MAAITKGEPEPVDPSEQLGDIRETIDNLNRQYEFQRNRDRPLTVYEKVADLVRSYVDNRSQVDRLERLTEKQFNPAKWDDDDDDDDDPESDRRVIRAYRMLIMAMGQPEIRISQESIRLAVDELVEAGQLNGDGSVELRHNLMNRVHIADYTKLRAELDNREPDKPAEDRDQLETNLTACLQVIHGLLLTEADTTFSDTANALVGMLRAELLDESDYRHLITTLNQTV